MLCVGETGHLSQLCEKCYEMTELKIFLKEEYELQAEELGSN